MASGVAGGGVVGSWGAFLVRWGDIGDAEGEVLLHAGDVTDVEDVALVRRFGADGVSDAVGEGVLGGGRGEVCGQMAGGGKGALVGDIVCDLLAGCVSEIEALARGRGHALDKGRAGH